MIEWKEELINLETLEGPVTVKALTFSGLACHLHYDLSGKDKGYVVSHITTAKVISPKALDIVIFKKRVQAKHCIIELVNLGIDWTKENPMKDVTNFQGTVSRIAGIFNEALNTETELLALIVKDAESKGEVAK